MSTQVESLLRKELSQRRQKLQAAIQRAEETAYLNDLLAEVDMALERMDKGSYGLCETCHDPIETDRLCADPLLRFCLDHLSPSQQRALEQDLELARQIQRGLLPNLEAHAAGWQVAYHYEAAGPVSGDYCDLVNGQEGSFHFLLGDVSGKGVAASLLMTHLHALFRSLITSGVPLQTLVAQASRVFCESTLPTHFATLVCGLATPSGQIEICNAGHLPPLLVRADTVERIDGAGLPIGLFCNEQFTSQKLQLKKGDALLLYTDGISEALDTAGNEYGIERLISKAGELRQLPPEILIRKLLADVSHFRSNSRTTDDASLMVIRKSD